MKHLQLGSPLVIVAAVMIACTSRLAVPEEAPRQSLKSCETPPAPHATMSPDSLAQTALQYGFEFTPEMANRAPQENTRGVMGLLHDGISRFHCDTGRLPRTLEELLTTEPSVKWVKVQPHLLKDAWKRDFVYKASEKGYELRSGGPDSVMHTADDVVFKASVPPEGATR